MSALTLYEIARDFRAEAEKLADLDLDEQTLADTLESMSGDLEVKCQNTAMVVRNLEATAAAIKEAEATMAARRKALENRATWLKGNILAAMQSTGVLKIESPFFKLAVRDNPPAVEVFDQEQVPEEFLRKTVAAVITDAFDVTHDAGNGLDWITVSGPREAFKFAEDPDKAAIKEAIKAKKEVAGCRVTVGKRLDIK